MKRRVGTANGRIDHREQGGGHLDKGHTWVVGEEILFQALVTKEYTTSLFSAKK
jgi:hypothetical protein